VRTSGGRGGAEGEGEEERILSRLQLSAEPVPGLHARPDLRTLRS